MSWSLCFCHLSVYYSIYELQNMIVNNLDCKCKAAKIPHKPTSHCQTHQRGNERES